jgi:hypothetical protein
MMTNAKWVLVLGAVLLLGFFLPWVSFFISFSGFDLVRMGLSQSGASWQLYLVVLIPIFAIGAIICGARAQGHRLAALLAGLIFPLLIIIALIQGAGNEVGAGREGGPNPFSLIGIGAYMCIAASIGLLITAFRKN